MGKRYLKSSVPVLVMILSIMLSISVASAAIGYGTGDWSNGPEWWSQGQSKYSGVRDWGCLVVAQARMLAKAGIASADTASFNPDVYYEWEVENNYIYPESDPNYGMITKNYAGPQEYARQKGKVLNYEGCTYTSSQDKIWENINAGKYSIVRVYTSGSSGSHYMLVNNGASSSLGYLRVYESWTTGNIPGTRDLASSYTIREVLTYSLPAVEVRGSEMSTGYDRALPDGDYLIVSAATSDKSSFYYIDIEGTAQPAANDTNVSICGPLSENPPAYEIWTIAYNSSDKFYTIKQKGTNMCLDVHNGDTLQGTNVKVYSSNNGTAQKWAIRRWGNGYELRPKCSGGGNDGMCLDLAGGTTTSGTNIRMWKGNSSAAQTWLFIPYNPSQPIDNGRYILLYNANKNYELDVAGNSGDIPVNTNVQLWGIDALSQFNSFDFIRLSNGYYKIRHAASGMCLDVSDGVSTYKANVAVHTDNGTIAQQWAVVANGSGYNIISRCNGYYLDLPDGTTGDGKNVEVYPWMNNNNQKWSFTKAEHTISFDLNGGSNGPESQVKYFNNDLTLSSIIPTKAGHSFVRWEYIDLGVTYSVQPGAIISIDKDLTLTAIWRANNYTLSYNGNGGSSVPEPQYSTGASVTIPSDIIPSRPHYIFRGWAESASATVAEYVPGDTYSKGITTTLYAVWERSYENIFVLPAFLTEIEEEAFLDTNADVIVIPATITAIGENAFGDVVIYGYSGTVAETYAGSHNLTFVPIESGWVLESEIPSGAHITDNKWSYTLTTTNTTTSTASSMDGWMQAGYDWQQTGTGNWKYASYPSGFDTGSSLYNKYNKSALSAGEQSTGENTKRIVNSGSTFVTYIYWHWTFVDSLNNASDNHNVLVEDAKKYNVQTGNVYRDYIYFDAFEDTVDHGTVGPGSSGMIDVAPMRYAWRDVLGDVSHWWWIFEVRQQTYTDYQKLFTYVKDESEILESNTEVTAGNGISNVQHWVKYGF